MRTWLVKETGEEAILKPGDFYLSVGGHIERWPCFSDSGMPHPTLTVTELTDKYALCDALTECLKQIKEGGGT